jgi:hypothetical protein
VQGLRSLWVVLCLLLAQASPAAPSDADTIYVVRRGWHIDIGFAVPELVAPLGSITGEFPGARYLLFGFGDRRYLMAKHSHVPAMLGAVWPGQGLILVTGLAATPGEAFGEKEVIALHVSPAQATELQAFIAGSLQADGGGSFVVTAPGPYGGSLYFNSGLKYSGLHTCNTWAAEGLRRAQLPVRSRGTLLAGQLWRQAAKLAAPVSPSRANEGAQ